MSVSFLKAAFKSILSTCLQLGIALDDILADLAVRIAKDLGKVYYFAQATEVTNELDGTFVPGMYLDFAYLVSCYHNGPEHPTSMNIKRLDQRSASEIGSVTDRYNRLMPWLNERFWPPSAEES